MHIRPVQDGDHDGIMALIDAVLREYGDRLWIDGADADLLDIHGRYVEAGGAFVVLDDGGLVRGTHAALPLRNRPAVCTFRRLYLDRALRGTDWGSRLMDWAIDWARSHAIERVEFWSDSRFKRAHRFFSRFGFQRDGRSREMDDGSMPYEEYFFYLELDAPPRGRL